MATSPLSSTLSPAQIAIVQQARAHIQAARPKPAGAVSRPAPGQQASAASAAPTAPVQGRGRIVNIVV